MNQLLDKTDHRHDRSSRWRIHALVLASAMVIPYAMGGSIEAPPAGPASTNGAMYTLEAVYQRLAAGASGSKRAGSFAGPTAGPLVATGHTLDQVMAVAPAEDENQGATTNDVLQNGTFWCLQLESWGTQTGTMTNQGSRSFMPGASDIALPVGYHDGGGSVNGDAGLVPGNIRKDVVLFGVTGTYEGEKVWPAPVAQTGQSGSFFAGDDGELEHGMAWPSPRFITGTGTNANVVLDCLTGLMWMKDAGLSGSAMRWQEALDYCNNLSLDGYDDWRMPNLRELHSLCDFGETSPVLPDDHPFVNVANNDYWSSTLRFEVSGDYHWAVNMADGGIEGSALLSLACKVWAVRGGE